MLPPVHENPADKYDYEDSDEHLPIMLPPLYEHPNNEYENEESDEHSPIILPPVYEHPNNKYDYEDSDEHSPIILPPVYEKPNDEYENEEIPLTVNPTLQNYQVTETSQVPTNPPSPPSQSGSMKPREQPPLSVNPFSFLSTLPSKPSRRMQKGSQSSPVNNQPTFNLQQPRFEQPDILDIQSQFGQTETEVNNPKDIFTSKFENYVQNNFQHMQQPAQKPDQDKTLYDLYLPPATKNSEDNWADFFQERSVPQQQQQVLAGNQGFRQTAPVQNNFRNNVAKNQFQNQRVQIRNMNRNIGTIQNTLPTASNNMAWANSNRGNMNTNVRSNMNMNTRTNMNTNTRSNMNMNTRTNMNTNTRSNMSMNTRSNMNMITRTNMNNRANMNMNNIANFNW